MPTVEWAQEIGRPECPYIRRWTFETKYGSIRLHHWLGPDDHRANHDHPWNFVTFVVKGGYINDSPEGLEYLKAPKVQYRSASHQHHVIPDKGGAWTIMITGPVVRPWGFIFNGRWANAKLYLKRKGYHPCD